MKKIYKFTAGRQYSALTSNYWYVLTEREGTKLTFQSMRFGARIATHTVIAHYEADDEGAYEVVRIIDDKGCHTLTANVWTTPSIPVSQLPPDEQQVIMDAIAQDVAYRKEHNINSSDILTEHAIAPDGSVTITTHDNKEK